LFGETRIELRDIFSNPNDKFVFEALLNNENKESKIYLELEWNSEEQTMEL